MRYNTRSRYGRSFLSGFPPAVKWLLIVNSAIWLLDEIFSRWLLPGRGDLLQPFKLIPDLVLRGAIWQPVTYMFLHSLAQPSHILFNMLALWMFGAEIERTWGTRRFLKYYFVCGIGAAVCVILVSLLIGSTAVATYGASGAIFGLLLAFGLLFPNMTIILIIFPIKAKYLVMIAGGLALFSALTGGNDGVSNVAHLGGLLVGFLYMRAPLMRGDTMSLRRAYDKWKLGRAKRKFEVYMRKQGSKREPWVH